MADAAVRAARAELRVDVRRLVGLGGIIAAAILAQLNDQVVAVALADVAGNAGLAHDAAEWLSILYVVGEVIGMISAPALGLGFSFRRFALFAIALSAMSTLLMTWASSAPILLTLRFFQGLAGGFTIPLLMTTALRVLDPPIRLWGLAAYALTATFTPNLATTLAALWTDVVRDYRFIFLEAAPLAALAAVPTWWGMQQDPPNYARLAKFDWVGVLLVGLGFGSLAIMLEQGNRLDWFNSPLICVLALLSGVAIPLFIVEQLHAEVPLIRIDLFRRRNFAYAGITLILFLIVSLSASSVPISYLEQVHGYRPLQAQILTLEIAASQLVLLPATAMLLDIRRVDSRWVSFVGFALILGACVGSAHMTPAWTREQFYGWQAMQAVGFPFVVMPLLMMATNVVTADEGPYASAMINAPRAVAEALGAGLLAVIRRWRDGYHDVRITEIIGQDRTGAAGNGALGAAFTAQPAAGGSPSLEALNRGVQAAVTTLTTIDTYLVLGGIVVFLMLVLAILPERTYPPRIQLAGH